jgi:hypothetical protein
MAWLEWTHLVAYGALAAGVTVFDLESCSWKRFGAWAGIPDRRSGPRTAGLVHKVETYLQCWEEEKASEPFSTSRRIARTWERFENAPRAAI